MNSSTRAFSLFALLCAGSLLLTQPAVAQTKETAKPAATPAAPAAPAKPADKAPAAQVTAAVEELKKLKAKVEEEVRQLCMLVIATTTCSLSAAKEDQHREPRGRAHRSKFSVLVCSTAGRNLNGCSAQARELHEHADSQDVRRQLVRNLRRCGQSSGIVFCGGHVVVVVVVVRRGLSHRCGWPVRFRPAWLRPHAEHDRALASALREWITRATHTTRTPMCVSARVLASRC